MSRMRRRRAVLLSTGIVLLASWAAGAVYWLCWLNPQRRYVGRYYVWGDPLGHHRAWADTQKRIRRFGWWHDDFGRVGQWGDEEWVEWIMERIKPGDDIASCRAGHKHRALSFMTNQDLGPRPETWLQWWRENKHKTQVEWIREAFEKAAITLHTPLTKQDVRALLVLIGKRKGAVVKEGGLAPPRWESPWHLRYNAMRWLRDSNFHAYPLSVGELAGEDSESVLNGLLAFSEWSGVNRKSDTPGELPISARVRKWKPEVPPIAAAWVAWVAYGSLAVVLVSGVVCLRRGLRRRCT